MSVIIFKNQDYKKFISNIKKRIQQVQIKAAISVNRELLHLYWDLGRQIVAKQNQTKWGSGLINQMSKDLQNAFPDMKGFSLSNLKYIRQWYLYFENSQQVVGQITQIPWGHNIIIISKCRTIEESIFYIQKTIQNNWSRAVLTHHIEGGLYAREGKAINNFKLTLPKPQSDLANQTIKDPYNFDFLTIREKHDEIELEEALVNHVTKFLLELGAGFSYIGKQYRIEVAGDEFFIDLLFYHVKLHCYVVIELKTLKFKPEFAGKLNFYISAIDGILKTELDNPTIGILICKSKNDTVVEYTLKEIHKPIGVSEYTIIRNLPDRFKSSLPSIEEIENELRSNDE
jgi:predicted nuclease of restriction endonuclease-like (RecB) superfamily